jgi:hypothetical protein
MTDAGEPPQDEQPAVPLPETREEAPPDPVEMPLVLQQLRAAGLSDDQQAALTTALLRVLALWTQQATRDDVHAAQQALAQRLAQQLDARHEEMRRDLGYHADALREDLRGALAPQAELLRLTRVAPARRWDGPWWLLIALLGLTCAGVLLLVVRSVLGW